MVMIRFKKEFSCDITQNKWLRNNDRLITSSNFDLSIDSPEMWQGIPSNLRNKFWNKYLTEAMIQPQVCKRKEAYFYFLLLRIIN